MSNSEQKNPNVGRFVITRRAAATVAGLAMVVGGFAAATSANAASDLVVSAASVKDTRTTTIKVDKCNQNAAGATFKVIDTDNNEVVTNNSTDAGEEVPGWNHQWNFSFDWTAPRTGNFKVTVTCLGYSNAGAQVGSATFSVSGPASLNPAFTVSPNKWLAGDPVTLTVTGAAPGDEITFDLIKADTYSQPVGTFSAKADSTGKATTTVTWPAADPANYPFVNGTYEIVAHGFAGDSGTNGLIAQVVKEPSGVWFTALPGSGGGALPNTGD